MQVCYSDVAATCRYKAYVASAAAALQQLAALLQQQQPGQFPPATAVPPAAVGCMSTEAAAALGVAVPPVPFRCGSWGFGTGCIFGVVCRNLLRSMLHPTSAGTKDPDNCCVTFGRRQCCVGLVIFLNPAFPCCKLGCCLEHPVHAACLNSSLGILHAALGTTERHQAAANPCCCCCCCCYCCCCARLAEFLALGNDERLPPALPAINLLTGVSAIVILSQLVCYVTGICLLLTFCWALWLHSVSAARHYIVG
jgi:hypothetical protein